METKYPTLKRPRRKLCYITDKESLPTQLGGALTLEEEVDRMFDDIESCPPQHSSPLLLQSCDTDTNPSRTKMFPVSQQKCPPEELLGPQTGHTGDVLHATTGSLSPKLDIDIYIPFKAHGPVKTSSPIEHNMVVDSTEKLEDEKDRVALPILFNCADEIVEETNKDPLLTQRAQCNGVATEESDGDELESPPSRVTLTRMSSHKVKDKVLCRQENVKPPVPAVSQELELFAPEKTSESVHKQPPVEMSTRAGKDMTAFLEKLKLAVQPQSVCYKKSPVKVSPPPSAPEPEDDFFILDDDSPLWVSIPRKNATNKKQKLSKTSSTDKESLTDKVAKDSPRENPQEQPELVKGNVEQESQAVDKKIKKKKGKEKHHEVVGLGNDEDVLSSPRNLPASDLMEQQKLKKKKRQSKKVPSKETDNVEDQPKDIPNMEKGKEKPSSEAKTKAHKSSVRKNSKEGKENVKTSRADTRKKQPESDAVKDVPHVDVVKEPSSEPADAENLASFADKEVTTSKADGRATKTKNRAGSGGSLTEDAEDVGKRKRKKTGQWWLSCPQSAEETESCQPTPKMSKRRSKESKAAVPLPAKAKKDKVYKKKTNQKPPVQLSSEHTGEVKISTQTKKRNARGNILDRMKAADKKLYTFEAEQEQQEIPDQDLDQQQSSPLVLTHRDHSTDSGGQIFQKVYNHNMKLAAPGSPGSPGSPRQFQQQLMEPESEKRRRRPPGNWWTVNNAADDLESIPSQPQQLHSKEPKPQQEKKKQSKQKEPAGLGVPKNGNMVIPSKPPGGALMPPLKPLSAPKTVKRSLAKFNDIFTSGIVTPIVVSNRDAYQSNKRYITSHPAEEVPATDFVTCCRADKDILSGDGGGCRATQISQETPQGKVCQSETTRFEVLRSGPSSMIQLEQFEDNDDMILPSSRVQAMLAVSDLSAPPLKPLSLHPKDRAALTEWFQSLWSPSAVDGAAITPDQFDWYSYKDRALGIQADLNSSSICSGKILLGSHMKKPLWVDHSATTVFNLLTSSVSVTVNGSVSRYRPGQTFIVECGSAYSIHNSSAQPAVLFFTRILVESSD